MNLSEVARQQAFQQDGDMFLVLLVLTHEDLPDGVLRFAHNTVNVTLESGDYAGEYVAYPFELILPDQSEDSPPQASLKIDNVSNEIGQAIREIATRIAVDIIICQIDAPHTIEATIPGMELTDAKVDAATVSGELNVEDLTREPFPAYTFSPAEYSGLLR